MAKQSSRPAGAVVVTGASTGIGRACALHLASIGFRVFAGVRRTADAERLRNEASERLVPVRLDVTDASSLATAAKEVSAALAPGAGLAGLVNNAGIVVSGPLEFLPLEALRRQFEVNVFGVHAATQAFFPLLRRGRGRIVTIGSIGGRVSHPLVGAYDASKFAIEGLCDALRRELRGSGLEVSLVEPGAIATPIWDKSSAAADELLAQLPPEASERYATLIEHVRAAAAHLAESAAPADAVARSVARALTARRPRARYLVGTDARVQAALAWLLPDRVFDALLARFLHI